MASSKNKTARRREVRRTIPKRQSVWRKLVRRRETLWALCYLLVFTAIGGAMAIYASSSPRYQLGQTVISPVVARVDFQATNQQKTELRRQEARNRTSRVYTPNKKYIQSIKDKFSKLTSLAEKKNSEIIGTKQQKELGINANGLHQLREQIRDKNWQKLQGKFIDNLLNIAVISPDQYQKEVERGLHSIIIKPENENNSSSSREHIRYNNVWIKSDDKAAYKDKIETFAAPFPSALRKTVGQMVMSNPQPVYLYNKSLSQQKMQQRADHVSPITESFSADQVIVPAGAVLDAQTLSVIKTENNVFVSSKNATDFWLPKAGLVAIVMLIFLALWIYIASYYERILTNPMRGLSITLLMLLAQVIAVIFTQINPSSLYATAIAPTLMVAIILAITYNQRFALAVGVIQTLLVVVTLNLSVGFAITLMAGIAVATAQLNTVKTRSKLVITGCWAGLAIALAAFITEVTTDHLYIAGELGRILLQDCTWGFAAGAGTGAVAQALLPGIERIFKVTTAMTLKELNDASHPLLQRLAQEAPGTYQHSLRIADMAESGAEAIGADGLLCRVGAMYHDIGKINKPMYFIENQGGGPNKHGKLSPAMSLLIIVGHVKDGIEMAREYGIPSVLRHFIASHHGTTLVEYFFHAAQKQKEEGKTKEAPSEFEFRYPGPKPKTKETAILLLCDGIEGAARALSEPTPVRLEQVVRSMANKRLMDGQFDECSLTLQELAKIETAVTKTLCAVYHGRIKYPESKDNPQGKSANIQNNIGSGKIAASG